MTFDRLSTPLALALLVGVALLVLLLYWLRPPASAVPVASTLTWRRLAERSRRTRRWRRLLSLLLSLLAAAAMAAALAGLRMAPAGAGGPPLVVVIDTSATMAAATAGGATRLERAVAAARDEIVRSAGPIDLYDTTGQLAGARLKVADALTALDALEVHPARASLLPAAALGARPGEPLRLLFSDGVAPLPLPAAFERRSMFEPAINVGIIAFEAARSGSLVQAFVEVLNGSLEPVVAELLLDTMAGEVLVRRPLRLAPAERWSGVIDLAPLSAVVAASPVLRARVSAPGDALAVDDRAFAPVPLGAPLRVAIAGPEGTAVRRVLGLLPGIAVRSADAAEIAALGPDQADLVVLEERAPEPAPRLPALLIAPPPRSWIPSAEEQLGPSAWSPGNAGAELDGLRVESIARYPTADADPRYLARPASGPQRAERPELPLLLRRQGDVSAAQPPWVLLPFAVEGSNLPDREAFPGLLSTLLLELAGLGGETLVEPGVLELPAGVAADAAFELGARRFAEVEGPALLDSTAVAPLGPEASALNRTDWSPARFGPADALLPTASSTFSWRHMLLVLALAVAALELWTRSRGITE